MDLSDLVDLITIFQNKVFVLNSAPFQVMLIAQKIIIVLNTVLLRNGALY